MTLTRKDWKLISTIVLSTAGPSYAEGLRARAYAETDPRERERLLRWAAIVEESAKSPKDTVDAIEALHDLAFGKRRRKTPKRTRSRG